MKNKLPIRLNYIYFGIVFLMLACVHTWSVLVAAKFTDQFPRVFLLHAVVQAGIEALALGYVAAFLHARRARVLEGVFISFTVVLIIVHIIDFHLVRLMDLSIWFALDFVLDESWRNFLELLIASTVPFSLIFFGLIGLSAVLVFAIWFFNRTQAIITKKKLGETTRSRSGRVLVASLAVLCVFDYLSLQFLSQQDYDRLAKALPWKGGFFFSAKEQKIPCSLQPMPNIAEKLDEYQKPISTPNIFLFVVETLREDFLTEEVAPNLAHFRPRQRPITYSSANATQDSWFSIFFAQSPLHFGQFHKQASKEGSPILSKFKKAGYKLHLYSGSRLTYYGMSDLLFGENYSLIDDVNLDFPSRHRVPWQCDQAMVKHLCDDLRNTKDQDGHMFIVFIESPHFTYSWPEDKNVFSPCATTVNFSKTACSPVDFEDIKNRYRNSIHFVDRLFGQFFKSLKKNGLYENAVIAITADHGEEFFEHGNLFHASGLCEEQIRVPIYFHMKGFEPQADLFSHVDIMPTLLHRVFGQKSYEGLYGKSVASGYSKRTVVSGRYNGSRTPHEFIMQSGASRLHARFSKPASPAASKSLIVLSYEGEGDPSMETFASEFGASFTSLFKKDYDLRIEPISLAPR